MKHDRNIISPTGKGLRSDPAGDGSYGARRAGREHEGYDFLGDPGQQIVMPFNGLIERIARPYRGDTNYSGALIVSDWIKVKLFYFAPFSHLIGRPVGIGAPIGTMQDITRRYPPPSGEKQQMLPHVHFQISSIDPEIFIKKT